VLPLLPVFEKNFLTFFNAEAICILDPFSFQPRDTCRLNRYAFAESFSPFAGRDSHRPNHPVYSEPSVAKTINRHSRSRPLPQNGYTVLGNLFRRNHFSAFIRAAIRTNTVGHFRFTALRADRHGGLF